MEQKIGLHFIFFNFFFLPDRQSEIACVFFAGSSQEAAVNPSTFQDFLGLQACDVSVEPPVTVQVQSRINTGSVSLTNLKHTVTRRMGDIVLT